MKRKLPLILLCIAFLAIAVFSGYQLAGILSEYWEGEQTYHDLEQYVSVTSPTPPVDEEEESTEPVDDTVWPDVDFDALKAINPDIVG